MRTVGLGQFAGRVRDMPDSVPKYSGYFASELAVGKLIMGGL